MLQLDETAVTAARQAVGAALPDVGTLTRMANAFFRALPGEGLPADLEQVPASLTPSGFGHSSLSQAAGGVAPEAWVPAAAQPAQFGVPVPSMPGPVPAPVSITAAPGFGSAMPQSGAAVPGVPSLPNIDKIPTESDLARLYGRDWSRGLGAEAAAFAPGPGGSLYDAPVPAGYSTGALSASPQPGVGSLPGTEVAQSPFAMPLPEFDLAFPNFEASLPVIPALPAQGDDDWSQAALKAGSQFYFLEQSGALSQPVETAQAPHTTQPAQPSVLPEIDTAHRQFDVTTIRRDFPILNEKVNGKPLIWLDNAATTQKPQAVIDRISWFYEHENSNIHRAAHELAARATDAYEDARNKVAHFLKASSSKEIIFVRGATEAINLIAGSWGRRFIGKDDEIVVSWIEHHANIVPWQMLAQEKGARLRVIPVDDTGQILLDEYEKLLNPRTKLVSFTQVSNALGTVTPVNTMVQMAHRHGARVLVDGAQAVSHMPVDVQDQDCDFFVFSGHKVFGPTGIGVVYGKEDVLADMPPWQGGGNMIVDVTFEKTIYQGPPARFEAGTGNIADAVGLGAAIAYVERIGMENIARHEYELLVYATKELLQIPGLHLIGTAKEKAGVLSFVLDGYRTEEVGAALNKEGIAVRSGHHCAQPALRRFGQETSVRPSLALYNNHEDIDALIAVLRRLR